MWPSKSPLCLVEPGERQTAVRIIFRQPFGIFELYMWNCDAIPGGAQSGLDLWRSIFCQQENRRARTRARLLKIFLSNFPNCIHGKLVNHSISNPQNHLLLKSLWICVLHLTWDLIVYVGPEGFLLSDIHTYIHTHIYTYTHLYIHTYVSSLFNLHGWIGPSWLINLAASKSTAGKWLKFLDIFSSGVARGDICSWFASWCRGEGMSKIDVWSLHTNFLSPTRWFSSRFMTWPKQRNRKEPNKKHKFRGKVYQEVIKDVQSQPGLSRKDKPCGCSDKPPDKYHHDASKF